MSTKLNTIKDHANIKVSAKVPVSLDNLDQVKLMLHEVKEGESLSKVVIPTIYLVEAKEALTMAKKKLNEAIKEQQAQSKAIEVALDDLEKEVKETVLSRVEITKTPAKDKSGNIKTDMFGEVEFKLSHNLDTELFSFTPATEKVVIDNEALLNIYYDEEHLIHDYPQLEGHIDKIVKEVKTYEVDKEALNAYILEHGAQGLPTKIVSTPEKISLKGKNILENQTVILNKLEEKND